MNILHSYSLLLALSLLATSIAFFGLLHLLGARHALRRWADFNGFEILDLDLRLFSKGFIKWYVYFVRVRDKSGRERSGWVRCRSFLSRRTFGDKSTILWHEL